MKNNIITALILSAMVFLLLCVLSFCMEQKIVADPTINKLSMVSIVEAKTIEDSTLLIETREEHYQRLAGKFYTQWIAPHIEVIDKVLLARGQANNEELIQLMFYTGEHESHWNMSANNNNTYFGAFQFSRSTFKAWNKTGDINNMEDQINAFITMYENKRTHCGQFQVLCKNSCGWEPCLDYWIDNSFVQHSI